jgi:predicted transposase YbfD/YdcC
LTSDAMACQRDIAEKIVDKKADYVDLKGNQGTLREDVERFATEQKSQRLSRIRRNGKSGQYYTDSTPASFLISRAGCGDF